MPAGPISGSTLLFYFSAGAPCRTRRTAPSASREAPAAPPSAALPPTWQLRPLRSATSRRRRDLGRRLPPAAGEVLMRAAFGAELRLFFRDSRAPRLGAHKQITFPVNGGSGAAALRARAAACRAGPRPPSKARAE